VACAALFADRRQLAADGTVAAGSPVMSLMPVWLAAIGCPGALLLRVWAIGMRMIGMRRTTWKLPHGEADPVHGHRLAFCRSC
jgi:hypothetical protein